MAFLQAVSFRILVESLDRVFAHRLEHPKPVVLSPQEVLVDERVERVEVSVDHDLGRLERTAAHENAEPNKQTPLALVKQVVAPLNRCPQRLLTARRVAATG